MSIWAKYTNSVLIESVETTLTLEDIKNSKGNWSSIDGTSGAYEFKTVEKDDKKYIVIDNNEDKEYEVYPIIGYESPDEFEKLGGDIDEYYKNHVASDAIYDSKQEPQRIDYDENRDTSADDWDPLEFDKENGIVREDAVLEEDPINSAPSAVKATSAAPVDITKINVNELNQLKQLVSQKDQLDKKILALKTRINSMKESTEITEASTNEDGNIISLFNELNKMEKRHARILAQITSQLNKEKEDLHSQIKEITGKVSEDLTSVKNININESVSFKRYFTDTSYKTAINSIVESVTEEEKIIISNKIISCKEGNTLTESSSSIPDKTKLLETIEFYGKQNFKCRFINEALKMINGREDNVPEETLTEMAIRAPKKAFILRWADGVKPQQYLYPYDPEDKDSIAKAKEKALEAAKKKIAVKKNVVRVDDGMTGETITGDALKLGRTTGTTKAAVIAKEKKIASTSKFLLIGFKKSSSKAEAEAKKEKLMKLIPTIVKELKNPKLDILDYEDEISASSKMDVMFSIYNTEKDILRNALINKRANLGVAVVDMKTEKLLPFKEFEAEHASKVDYDRDVYKNDEMKVVEDKLVKNDPDEITPKAKKPKAKPSEAQLDARKKFTSGNKGLDRKTSKFISSGIKESVEEEPEIVESKYNPYTSMKMYL